MANKYYFIIVDVSKHRRKFGITNNKAFVVNKDFKIVDSVTKVWDDHGEFSEKSLAVLKKHKLTKNDIEFGKSVKAFKEFKLMEEDLDNMFIDERKEKSEKMLKDLE